MLVRSHRRDRGNAEHGQHGRTPDDPIGRVHHAPLLASLFTQAGLGNTQVAALTVRVRHADFDDWWQPLTLGVGPAGAYVRTLTADRRAALREQCRRLLPAGAVEITAVAWAASGRA